MPPLIRLLYVFTNPDLHGLVKVGYTTKGADQRAKELSQGSGLPREHEVAGVVTFPQELTPGELRSLEQESHRRLGDYRHMPNREYFQVSPERALEILNDVKQDALENIRRGLPPSGRPPQLPMSGMPKPQPADQGQDRKVKHWHVWTEHSRNGNRQIITLVLHSQTYWSRRGATALVRRNSDQGVHSEYLQCRDPNCPNFGREVQESPNDPQRDSEQAVPNQGTNLKDEIDRAHRVVESDGN